MVQLRVGLLMELLNYGILILNNVIEYFKNFDVVYKTLKNNTMLLILNEENFEKLLKDRFSILNNVRKISKEGGLDVTLSMGFARGSDSFDELDEVAQ